MERRGREVAGAGEGARGSRSSRSASAPAAAASFRIRRPIPPAVEPLPIVFSVLDRASLSVIATAGGGRYFELDRESDREITSEIIGSTRRRAGFQGIEEATEPLYWRLLFVTAGLICVGCLFLQERAELAIQVAGAAIVLAIVTSLTG